MLIVTKNVLAVIMLVNPHDAGDGPPKLGTGGSKTSVQKKKRWVDCQETIQSKMFKIIY